MPTPHLRIDEELTRRTMDDIISIEPCDVPGSNCEGTMVKYYSDRDISYVICSNYAKTMLMEANYADADTMVMEDI